MSIYNLMNGFSSACLIYLPMLDKHPNDYPRFRDCFLKDNSHPEYDFKIHVYTRTGGPNRIYYREENKILKSMDDFIATYDDKFDNTYASWIFKVPDKWEKDFNFLINKEGFNVSEEYINQIKSIYPKLISIIDKIFSF